MHEAQRAAPVRRRVHVLQRIAHIHHHVQHRRDRQPLAARDHALVRDAQRDAGDVLHRDEVAPLELAEVEDVDDVRVAELRGDRRLADEHLHQLGPALQGACIVLMTIRFSNPCAPLIFARHTSAIPPAASRESISYLLNSVPGSQGDGGAAAAGADSRWVADGAESLRHLPEQRRRRTLFLARADHAGLPINGVWGKT